MVGILIIGLALVAIAVSLFVRGASLARVRTSQTLSQIPSYSYNTTSGSESPAPARPVTGALDRAASLVGSRLAARVGDVRESRVRVQLMTAGIYSVSPRKFLGYRVLSFIGIPALWAWAAINGGIPTLPAVMGFVFSLLLGWQAPLVVLNNRMRHRLDQIDRDLPELIDVLVVTVEAGLGFSGSLQIAARRFEGPLGDELRLTLQEQSMGLAINDALTNMLERVDTPAMRSFVRSIVQGETLGVSIGQIMRNLAHEMRARRRARAEERAQKAPVKMLFPLIFLIFPAMFVVLLAPAVFSFIDAFSSRR